MKLPCTFFVRANEHTFALKLHDDNTHYVFESEEECSKFLAMLHVAKSVRAATVWTPHHRYTGRTVSKTKDKQATRLWHGLKAKVCIKVKSFAHATTAAHVADDLDRSIALKRLMKARAEVQAVVVHHVDVVPGQVSVMEKCWTDAWKNGGLIGEDRVHAYIGFGLQACAELAKHGLEARDYKAANVGCRGVGSTRPNTYCIIDTSQIMHIADSDTALCTYPAVKAWTFGEEGSLVGLAATAWSVIADAATMCDYEAYSLCHHSVDEEGDALAYGLPEKAEEIDRWCRESFEEVCPNMSVLLQQLLQVFACSFPPGVQPRSAEEAVAHASGFYDLATAAWRQAAPVRAMPKRADTI